MDSEARRRRANGTLFVLDHDFRIAVGNSEVTPGLDRLPETLERTVRALTQSWGDAPTATCEEVAFASPSLTVRVFPLHGRDSERIGVYLEPYQRRPTLVERADMLRLTPSEYEYLRLGLEGLSEAQIASKLAVPKEQILRNMREIQEKLGVKTFGQALAKLAGHSEASAAAPS